MAKFCTTEACNASTMEADGFQGKSGFKEGMCDTCCLIDKAVNELHDEIIEMRDGEAMDGDDTEMLSKIFLEMLDELNANK